MNFEHTEDRRMLADSLNRFIAEQYAFDARDRIAKSAHGFSKDIFQNFAELGVIGALFSEADGGFGGGGFDIAVVFEALGRGLVVEPLLGAVMVGEALSAAGNAAQKEKLGDIINGITVAAFAHDEADSHYERTRVATTAERSGDGWVLKGAKAVVPQGEQADLFLVSARTSGHVDDEAGISLFWCPRRRRAFRCAAAPPSTAAVSPNSRSTA
jgi:alkylation response protein AidB-like acyl-CoA dehydrogenase